MDNMSLRVLGKDWVWNQRRWESWNKILIRNFQKNLKFKNKYRQNIIEAFIFQEKAVFLIYILHDILQHVE